MKTNLNQSLNAIEMAEPKVDIFETILFTDIVLKPVYNCPSSDIAKVLKLTCSEHIINMMFANRWDDAHDLLANVIMKN